MSSWSPGCCLQLISNDNSVLVTDAIPEILYLNNLTCNCEGLTRNTYNLVKIIDTEEPSFIFLSEPWLHLPNAPMIMELFSGQYCFYLNSEDRHDNLLSLRSSEHMGEPWHCGRLLWPICQCPGTILQQNSRSDIWQAWIPRWKVSP